MTKHKNYELLLDDFRQLLADPSKADRAGRYYALCFNLSAFIGELSASLRKAQALLDIAVQVRGVGGHGQQVCERAMLESLDHLTSHCLFASSDPAEAPDDLLHQAHDPRPASESDAVLRALCEYAVGCFSYKRPRDSFAGERRAWAFALLEDASSRLEFPEVLEQAHAALDKDGDAETCAAINYLLIHHLRHNRDPSAALLKKLHRLEKCTLSRSAFLMSLDFKVQTGLLSDLEAGARLEDWDHR